MADLAEALTTALATPARAMAGTEAEHGTLVGRAAEILGRIWLEVGHPWLGWKSISELSQSSVRGIVSHTANEHQAQ